jgi:hypothetical protein
MAHRSCLGGDSIEGEEVGGASPSSSSAQLDGAPGCQGLNLCLQSSRGKLSIETEKVGTKADDMGRSHRCSGDDVLFMSACRSFDSTEREAYCGSVVPS